MTTTDADGGALTSGGGPQTEAGQVLLKEMMPNGPDFPATERRGYQWCVAMILSIEGQARTQGVPAYYDAPALDGRYDSRYRAGYERARADNERLLRIADCARTFLEAAALERMSSAPAYIKAKRALRAALDEVTP